MAQRPPPGDGYWMYRLRQLVYTIIFHLWITFKTISVLAMIAATIWFFATGGAPSVVSQGSTTETPEPTAPVTSTERPTPTPSTSSATETLTISITPEQQPEGKDTDKDGLSDARERELGTHPHKKDTDGDGLWDSWEVRGLTPSGAAIPNADPLHKDLYILVMPSGSHDPPSDHAIMEAKRLFDEMDVENPDGEDGITLHATTGERIDQSVDVRQHDEQFNRELYRQLGPRMCIYYQVVVGEKVDENTAGFGDAPGYQSIVVDESNFPTSSDYAVAIAHELLHNIVGQMPSYSEHTTDDGYHTTDGLLSHSSYSNQTLSSVTRDELNSDGFAYSELYQEEICDDG
jgi:hypothetical protein